MRNCGHELSETDRYCANCGTPVHEAAHVPTPEADRPEIPPAAEPGVWETLIHGPEGRPTQSNYQRRGPGVWSGAKIGCGIFILLPILLILLGLFFSFLLAVFGGMSGN